MTPRPDVAGFTDRWYESLPEVFRTADVGTDFTLLRFLDLIGASADTVEQLLDRFDPEDGSPSQLVDPDTADAGWLPWLAQLVGVVLEPRLSEPERRDAIRFASSGWRAGTKTAIADAARSALTGSRYVRVIPHRTPAGPGGLWDVLLVTRLSETPDVGVVLATVVMRHAKPAGVKLWHLAYQATWAQLEAAYPTWAARNGKTWRTLEETGAGL